LNAVKVEEEEEVLSIQAKFEGLPYPNPASGYLFVPSEKSTEVIIFDMKGREVSKGRTNSKIDVSKLKSGLYVAMIKKADGTYRNFRWVKE
jgi:hypothetical protein